MRSHHHHQLGGGDDSSSTSSESYLSADSPSVAYHLRENPRKSFRAADPDSAESETKLTRWPSWRTRTLTLDNHCRSDKRAPEAEQEPASSVSDASPEEEVAMFLVMMSRDVNWRKRNRRFINDDDEIEIEIAKKEDEEEVRERSNARVRRGINKLKCETCTKQFRSSPALATHRRICSLNTNGGANSSAAGERSIFRCPYCHKVFGSGQALGGHKRSHLSSTTGSYPSPPPPPAAKSNGGLLDLNFPPAATEDDDYSSVVSDA
ncbi:Zinc finger protein ZAT9 [Linum grandiflorum]